MVPARDLHRVRRQVRSTFASNPSLSDALVDAFAPYPTYAPVPTADLEPDCS